MKFGDFDYNPQATEFYTQGASLGPLLNLDFHPFQVITNGTLVWVILGTVFTQTATQAIKPVVVKIGTTALVNPKYSTSAMPSIAWAVGKLYLKLKVEYQGKFIPVIEATIIHSAVALEDSWQYKYVQIAELNADGTVDQLIFDNLQHQAIQQFSDFTVTQTADEQVTVASGWVAHFAEDNLNVGVGVDSTGVQNALRHFSVGSATLEVTASTYVWLKLQTAPAGVVAFGHQTPDVTIAGGNYRIGVGEGFGEIIFKAFTVTSVSPDIVLGATNPGTAANFYLLLATLTKVSATKITIVQHHEGLVIVPTFGHALEIQPAFDLID